VGGPAETPPVRGDHLHGGEQVEVLGECGDLHVRCEWADDVDPCRLCPEVGHERRHREVLAVGSGRHPVPVVRHVPPQIPLLDAVVGLRLDHGADDDTVGVRGVDTSISRTISSG
jgi:hypothetical protein